MHPTMKFESVDGKSDCYLISIRHKINSVAQTCKHPPDVPSVRPIPVNEPTIGF